MRELSTVYDLKDLIGAENPLRDYTVFFHSLDSVFLYSFSHLHFI